MISRDACPQGTIVVCIDPPLADYAVVRKGALYRIQYWDGSNCVVVADDNTDSVTLNVSRFDVWNRNGYGG
jgi:hypothetical protein